MTLFPEQTLSAWRGAILAAALLLVPSAWAEDSVELPQDGGGTLELATPAHRIITLSPNLAELVFAAGAGDYLLATVEYSDFPAEVLELPKVGDAFRINIERIHQLKPDLVIAWQSGNPGPALAQLEELGFNVWRTEIYEPGEIAGIIRRIGQAARTEDVANATAAEIDRKLLDLKNRFADAKDISYFYQVASEPLYTVSGDHLISQGLSMCGGQNVFGDLSTLAPQIGFESVLLADPAVFIGPDIDSQDDPLAQWREWPRLSAVRNEHFMLLPADPISRATPRFVDAIVLACNMMDEYR